MQVPASDYFYLHHGGSTTRASSISNKVGKKASVFTENNLVKRIASVLMMTLCHDPSMGFSC